ncbi:hypothetical protein ACN20G_28080 (plasmid) [Streptomyces sp. BI20]|uniref:hypothetical protein n=1 Tax=Streptomyces sp. BI20 TaxID=3403460 RepID=UPI003C721C36
MSDPYAEAGMTAAEAAAGIRALARALAANAGIPAPLLEDIERAVAASSAFREAERAAFKAGYEQRRQEWNRILGGVPAAVALGRAHEGAAALEQAAARDAARTGGSPERGAEMAAAFARALSIDPDTLLWTDPEPTHDQGTGEPV